MAERIWDPFLSERDKAHVAASRHIPSFGFGKKAAVLSVDNYRAGIGDEPEEILEAIATWPGSTGLEGWAALAGIERLLSAARERGVEVIHTTGLPEEESGIPGWIDRRRPTKSPTPAESERFRRRYDIVEQAAPLPGEVVIRKNSPSAFFGTPLMSHLVAQGVDTLLVCGQSASGCVRSTVIDGRSYRFRVIVIEDCVYDSHEVSLAISLFDIDQRYGDVISLDEALRHLAAVDATTS